MINDLESFLDKDLTKKQRKALAVKLRQQGLKYEDISTVLNVEVKHIKSWETLYNCYGLKGLNTRSGVAFLTPEEESQVLTWIKTQGTWDINKLESYLLENYQLKYAGKNSYFSLFHKAGIEPPKRNYTQQS